MTHWLEDEHAIVRTQQLGDKELEELLLDPPSIDAVLANEVHSQGLEQVACSLPGDLIQGILHTAKYLSTLLNHTYTLRC